MKSSDFNSLSYYRKNRRRKIRWLFFLVVFLIGGLAVGSAYFAFQSDFLKVAKITVENNRLTNEHNLLPVLNSAIIQKQSWRKWFGPDRFIFWLGINSLSGLRQTPLVAGVEIKTDVKRREVVITVNERQAAGLWCPLNAECVIFDKVGMAFAYAPRAEGHIFLKISDQEMKAIRPGQPLFEESSWFGEILKIIDVLKLNRIDFGDIVVKPHYLKEWELNLAEGPVLKFSFDQIPYDFGKAITNLQKTLDWSKLIYIDFRVANRIYYQ